MKTPRVSNLFVFLSAALALTVLPAHSAPAAKSRAAAPVAVTNAIPQSVFIIPSVPGNARDPFFPDRIIQAQTAKAVTSTNSRPTGASCLVLKGLSGVPENRLAMINGRTMARGEDAEINTECGRLLVHCVDITANSAIIEVGGERRELHLRSDF
jgi:hypothetical protein